MKKKIASIMLILALSVALTHCGGSGSGTDENTPSPGVTPSIALTPDQEANADILLKSTIKALTIGLSFPGSGSPVVVPKDLGLKLQPITCDNGGTIEYDATGSSLSLTFADCEVDIFQIKHYYDGFITIDSNANGTTLEYNLEIGYYNPPILTTNFELIGSIEVTSTTLVFDITGTFDSQPYRLAGNITDNQNGTFTGNYTITVGQGLATCVFDNFDPDTATEADYAAACGF